MYVKRGERKSVNRERASERARELQSTEPTEPYGCPLSEMQMTVSRPITEILRANIDSSWGGPPLSSDTHLSYTLSIPLPTITNGERERSGKRWKENRLCAISKCTASADLNLVAQISLEKLRYKVSGNVELETLFLWLSPPSVSVTNDYRLGTGCSPTCAQKLFLLA